MILCELLGLAQIGPDRHGQYDVAGRRADAQGITAGRSNAFEGDVKLTDFGIAKARGFLTDQEGEVVAGKADYMSPEQANFQVTDKRSDLFSVGVVLSHLLLGRNIFKGRGFYGLKI